MISEIEMAKYEEIDRLEKQRQFFAQPGDVAFDYQAQQWLRWTGREWVPAY